MRWKLANEAKLGVKSHEQVLRSCAAPPMACAAVVFSKKQSSPPHALRARKKKKELARRDVQEAALGAQ